MHLNCRPVETMNIFPEDRLGTTTAIGTGGFRGQPRQVDFLMGLAPQPS